MTIVIDTIESIASNYDVIVFDQWGVLHNGSEAYEGAIDAVAKLSCKTAVLSNSGKRSKPNAARITSMGFPADAFDYIMTSGEALYREVSNQQISARSFFAVERAAGDAEVWAAGLDVDLVETADDAEAILMMGLPDGAVLFDWAEPLQTWRQRDLPMYCSNPDRQSPRAGELVISPGTLAFAYQDLGGQPRFYGKPHLPVFKALEDVFGDGRYLMVGDSMEHDIAGANAAGWDSLLIEGGLYAERFSTGNGHATVAEIAAEKGCDVPTLRIRGLR